MENNYVLIGLLAVFVGLIFVQNRNRKKQAAQMQENLKPGAEVMLTSGIIGVVEAIAGDRLIISTAGTTKIEVANGAVMRVLSNANTAAAPTSSNAVKKAAAQTSAAKSKSKKTGISNG